MNARFRSGFITIIHRVPGFEKFCAKRFRGTNRSQFPNNGESIILALNHQSYINKVNKKSNRIVKNDDYFNDDDCINNGMDYGLKHNELFPVCLTRSFFFVAVARFRLFVYLNFLFLVKCFVVA